MSDEGHPPPDQLPGAPHPRETAQVFGHNAAEQEMLRAFASGRMHHAWMITGPKGIGKATLAWRFARFLLSTPPSEDNGLFGAPPPPETLEISPDHPVARNMMAGATPGLKQVIRTPNERGVMRKQISVEDVRALVPFFGLSAAHGGPRVVIVDAADEMNTQAANALLKMLEEPPARAVLLLIAHQPSRLLPTIRSRCRTLRLTPPEPEDVARALDQAGVSVAPEVAGHLAELSGGSIGAAMQLLSLDGLALYSELLALFATLPRMDRARATTLSRKAAGRDALDRANLILDMLDILLARLARTGATGTPPPEAAQGEAQILARLSPDAHAARRWADRATALTARARHGLAVNLDPAALVLDTVLSIEKNAVA